MALIVVCDECAERKGVATYAIEGGGRKASVDLCEAHAKVLVDLMDLVKDQPTKAPAKRTPRKPRASRVVSMEEIEALKG